MKLEVKDEIEESFEIRASRIVNYLIRAYKHNQHSILFGLYLSEFTKNKVEEFIKNELHKQGLEVVKVDTEKHIDLPAHLSSINSKNRVFFVHNVGRGFPDVLQYLNFRREYFGDNCIKVVFWVNEEELARISLEAPDFFAFRNRVVEFMETPAPIKELEEHLKRFTLDEYKTMDDIKRSIALKEDLLSRLSSEDEISAYMINSLGILYLRISNYKKAIEYHEKALKIYLEIGNKLGEKACYICLGSAYHCLNDFRKAIEYYERALKICLEMSDRSEEVTCYMSLGDAYYDLYDFRKAIEYYEKALKICLEIGNKSEEGMCYRNLGATRHSLGEFREAIEYHEKALKIYLEIDDKSGEGACYVDLGNVYRDLGNFIRAIEYYEKALKICLEIDDKSGEGACYVDLGNVYHDLGNFIRAIEYYEKALKICLEIGDKSGERKCYRSLSIAYRNLGDSRKAIEYQEKAEKIL